MAQVKEFIAKVKAEIDSVLADRVDAKTADNSLEILLRYESRWAFMLLQKMLDAHANDDQEITPETLQFLTDFLQTRFRLIKNTDAIYNHSNSEANIACVILAKNVFAELKSEDGKQHYYEYLFPSLRCSRYKTTRGDLGALKLHEFFWSDDDVPVETLACLDAYRREIENGVECYPQHVCLSEKALQDRPNSQLSYIEVKRLMSHSDEANKYIVAIDGMSSSEDHSHVDACRAALAEKMSSDDFYSRCTYNQKSNQSNINLLRNGFLKELEVNDLASFARLLFNAVKRKDWIEFVSAIDDPVFFQIALPKVEEVQPAGTSIVTFDGRRMLERPSKSRQPLLVTEDASRGLSRFFLPDLCEVRQRGDGSISLLKPDTSLLRPEKFKAFIDSLSYSKDRESDANKSILFLLTELYLRNRHSHEGLYNGALGPWVGTEQSAKESAAGKLREFFTKKSYHRNNDPQRPKETYLINQIHTYLKDTGSMVHKHALEHDRLGYITGKAASFGPGLRESAQNLGALAEQLSQIPGDRWVEEILSVPDSLLQSYVDSSGGFVKCVRAQEYKENNHQYNKAILFILTEHYIRDREKGDEHKSFLGRYNWGKLEKVEAGKIFRNFLCSDKPPNRLTEYLQQINRSKYESIIRDQFSLFSELGTLSSQAEAICRPAFYQPQNSWVPATLKGMF